MRLGALPVLLALLTSSSWVHARAQIGVSAELGPELDTNANRTQPLSLGCPAGSSCVAGACVLDNCTGNTCVVGGPCTQGPGEQAVTAALLRLSAEGRLRYRIRRNLLLLSYGGGGKLFLRDAARGADELVQQASAGWSVRLPRGALSLEGNYYDAFQRASQRDFRQGTGALRLGFGERSGGVAASGGLSYRALQYKPLPDYDFHGPVATLELGSTLSSGPPDDAQEWDLSLAYAFAARFFAGLAEGHPSPCSGHPEALCSQSLGRRRRDLNHLLRAEVSYLGRAAASLSYTVDINQSDSYGEAYVRHMVGLKFTAPLPWKVYFTAKGVLQLCKFNDPLLLSRVLNQTLVTIEDENRSRLVVQLARDLRSGLAAELRYSLYLGESPGGGELAARLPAFQRQTLFAGLRFDWER